MRYTAKKIATMLLTMVIVSVFDLRCLLPPLRRRGDAPARYGGDSQRLEALRIELGLNDPLLVRYGRWLGMRCAATSAPRTATDRA